MKRSTSRILTTHAGSLPRPADLLEMTQASSTPTDVYAARVRRAVAEIVEQQIATGLDVVDDGEMSKPSFVTYVQDRLGGFESTREPAGFPWAGSREVRAFPEFYEENVRQGGNAARLAPALACTGPVTYTGRELVRRDIENLQAALRGRSVEDAFIPAISVSNVEGRYVNRYYVSDEDYLYAIADAMHEEYRAITDAGFLLQIDD